MPRIIHRVFVSSTYDDLREERSEVQKALLMLDCFPVGMELFPADNDETWNFIERQISESDYYIVIVAGRYGSTAPDGIGFTEKEYDYARKIGKPTIAFLHKDVSELPAKFVESDAKLRKRLEAFKLKLKPHPVRFFSSPHQLATEVLASVVKLRDSHPALGFIHASEAADLKRYSELLEEVALLKEQLIDIQQANPLDRLPNAPELRLAKIANGVTEWKKAIPLTWDEVLLLVGRRLLFGPLQQSRVSIFFREKFGASTIENPSALPDIMGALAAAGIIESARVDRWSCWHLTDRGREEYFKLATRPLDEHAADVDRD